MLLRHQLRDLLVEILLEADVAAGENADGVVAFDDRKPRNLVTPHELERVVERLAGSNGHRVDDHTRLCALHFGDFERLKLGAHVLVEDADAAFASHGHRGAPLGHGVHRARHEGDS